MEEGKDYSVESNMVVQGYKKKGIYKPFVSIRTPTEEKLAFGGSVSVIYGKKVDLNLVLDKIVEKSVVLKGNVFIALYLSCLRRKLKGHLGVLFFSFKPL